MKKNNSKSGNPLNIKQSTYENIYSVDSGGLQIISNYLVDAKKLKAKIVKQDLINNGLVQKNELVKILGRGKLTVKIDITANAFSSSAKLAIEKAGGKANIIVK